MILAGDFIPQDREFVLDPSLLQEPILANLEGPVCSDGLEPSMKVGVCLHTVPRDWEGRWMYSLANNHMMDYCAEGLWQTKDYLERHGICSAGAGKNIIEARKPVIVVENNLKIAIFSCCERQFGMASNGEPGCAPLGVWLHSAIKQIKESHQAQAVIVSCHAASEFSPWPSPSLRSFYHSLVDAGADIIHGHHSHVPQGYEIYNGHPIFYGLGNFVVDPSMWRSNKNQLWSIVVKAHFDEKGLKWSAMPYGISEVAGKLHIRPLTGDDESNAIRYISNANYAFRGDDTCVGCWQEMAMRLYPRIYMGNLRVFLADQKRLTLKHRVKLLYFALIDMMQALIGENVNSARTLYYSKVAYNLLACQSHVDMISLYLGLTSGIVKDLRTDEIKRIADQLGV